MSGTCDDLFLHICRYVTHDHSLKGTERLLSTNRHHRHSQFGLFEDLVVLRILGEGGKLCEPGPHSAWLCVGRGKEISGVFVWFTWISSKVIPYPVKVDTLAACYQAFRIRSVKVEVPNSGILQNLTPRINPRNRCIHNDQPLNLVGVHRSIGVRDHIADIVSNNKCLVVSERGDNGTHILGLSL